MLENYHKKIKKNNVIFRTRVLLAGYVSRFTKEVLELICGQDIFTLMRHKLTSNLYFTPEKQRISLLDFFRFGAIQEKLARMHAEQYATEAVAYLVAIAMDNKTTNYHLEAACSKVFASECAWRCVDETIQTMGGMGYMFEQVGTGVFYRMSHSSSFHFTKFGTSCTIKFDA